MSQKTMILIDEGEFSSVVNQIGEIKAMLAQIISAKPVNNKIYTLPQAAKMLGVGTNTMRTLIEEGLVSAKRKTSNYRSHYMISDEDIQKYISGETRQDFRSSAGEQLRTRRR